MQLVRKPVCVGFGAVLIVAMIGLPLGSQTTLPPPPPLLIPSMYGGDLFQQSCASCHGRDGKGYGPAAEALKQRPPDLTTMARRHEGVFPTLRVSRLLDGSEGAVPFAHGSSEMPVWGPVFKALDTDPKAAEIRIANLVAYVESIQVK